jgi:hypothetical protein
VANLFLGQTFWMRFHEVDSAHYHSGRTVPALQSMMFPEHLLHRVQGTVSIHQSFYSPDCGSRSLNRQHCARFHGHAADLNDTGPALAGIAPHMRSREPQLIPQKLNKKRSGFNIGLVRFTVYRQAYLGQLNLLLLAKWTLW